MRQLRAAALASVATAMCVASVATAADGPSLTDFSKSGDMARVRSLVKERPKNIDARSGDGMTALMWAVYRDDAEMVRLLLDAGANPGIASQYGVTALGLASENRNAAVAGLLLARGADPNAETSSETSLHIAARTGALAVLRVLFEHGARADVRDAWQSATPLMVAAAENHPEVVNALISAGADVNAKAAETRLFIGPGDESTTYTQIPRGGMTPLMFAARAGCRECVAALADAGADVKYEDRARVTPLNLAVYNGHFDTASALLDKGADPNDGSVYLAVDMRSLVADGVTADHHPVPRTDDRLDGVAILRQLLARGGGPDDELLKEIQARSLGFNRPKYLSGLTPLERAAQQADLESMQLLLEFGADPNRPAETIAGSGSAGGDAPLLWAVRSYGGVPSSTLGNRPGKLAYRARQPGDSLAAVRLLLDAGADAAAADWAGTTAVHAAALLGATDIIQLLSEWGADLDVKDEAGRTPLDLVTAPGRGSGRGTGGPAPSAPATAALLRRLLGLPTEAPSGREGQPAEGAR